MRFAIFAALLLGVAAHPAEKRDTCCCCDVHLGAMICKEATTCVCPGVMCPASAPTIWRDSVKPTPVAALKREPVVEEEDETGCEPRSDDDDDEPADEEDGFECCCCDASKPAIVCSNRASSADCICPAIACPTSAPTIYETETTATPTPTPTPTPSPTPEVTPATTPDPEPCCCCNAGEGAIVCEMRSDGGDLGCFCPMVMCPSGAPTRTVWPDQAAATP